MGNPNQLNKETRSYSAGAFLKHRLSCGVSHLAIANHFALQARDSLNEQCVIKAALAEMTPEQRRAIYISLTDAQIDKKAYNSIRSAACEAQPNGATTHSNAVSTPATSFGVAEGIRDDQIQFLRDRDESTQQKYD